VRAHAAASARCSRVVVVTVDEAQFGHAARRSPRRATASKVLAVVAAAYCGYSGSTSTRVAPSACSPSSTLPSDGAP
jgi:hypothetical protein